MPDILQSGSTVRSFLTVKQLRTRVRAELGQFDTGFVTNDDIDSWLLEFQRILARDEEYYRVTDTFYTSGGTRYYSMPSDLITLSLVQMGVFVLPEIQLHDLVRAYPLALTDNFAGPLSWCYTVDGGNRLILFPTPTAASGVTLIYSALPPEPFSENDNYYWPPYFDTCAIYYGCMRGSLKDISREGQRRIANFTAAYEREYQKAAARLKGRGEEETIIFGRRQKSPRSGYSRTYPLRVPLP